MNLIKATYSENTVRVNATGQYLSAVTNSTVHSQVQECYSELIQLFRNSFSNPTSLLSDTSELIAQILMDVMMDDEDALYQFDTATKISGLLSFNMARNRGELAIGKIYFSITEGMHVVLSNGSTIILSSQAQMEFHQLT